MCDIFTEKMAAAKVAIVFWTKDSCISTYVLKDVMQAMEWKKLVPGHWFAKWLLKSGDALGGKAK